MTDLFIGPYLCTGKEAASINETIVIFRNSTKERGGTGLFRMPHAESEKFEEGKIYRLFAVEDPNAPVPARLLRKKP